MSTTNLDLFRGLLAEIEPALDDAPQLRGVVDMLRVRVKQGGYAPVAQWQKRHTDEDEGQWQNSNEEDAKWWRDHSSGWEIRALCLAPSTPTTGAISGVQEALLKLSAAQEPLGDGPSMTEQERRKP